MKGHKQNLIILITIVISLILGFWFLNNLQTNPITLDFLNLGLALGANSSTFPILHSLIGNNLVVFTTYANGAIQISEVIAATLIGLYGLVFIEILKVVNDGTKDNTEYAKLKRYTLMIFAVLPFVFLFVSIINLFAIFKIYTNILWAATDYLVYSNTSNFAIYNGISNNVTIPSTASLIPPNQLFHDMTTFPNLFIQDVYPELELGIGFVVVNLFLYWIFKARKNN
ncbi:MAG: hypothetical protein KGH65_04610 [Candidatus Micrarchaeota archaeon]|nr:hypothetical protein [Candidatus Micrarchaeota archaeon]